MSGRDEGYYGPSDHDLTVGAIALIALAVLTVAALVALCVIGD